MSIESAKSRELSVLSYIVKHPGDFMQYTDVLRSYHFEYDPARVFFPVLLDQYEKYRKMPTFTEMMWSISQKKDYSSAPATVQAGIRRFVEAVYTTEVTPTTGNHIEDFILYKELQAIVDGIDENLKGDYRECIGQYKAKLETLELLRSGGQSNPILFPFSRDSINSFTELIEESAGGSVIPTTFPRLNNRSRGGIFKGDSTIVLGSTNVGKTTVLTSMAVGWVKQGYRVIYYAIDSAQDEMWERLYVRAANKPLGEEYNYEDLQADVSTVMGENLNLILRFFPAASATPQDVFRDYYRVKAELESRTGDSSIDIVIIDYGDQLIPTRKYGEKRHELAAIFTDFAGFAQKEKIHVISATQANRAALGKDVMMLEHIAECYAKSHPAANVWGLCQTDVEYHATPYPRFRLAVLKSRRGPKNYLIPMLIRYETQLVFEDSELPLISIVRDGNRTKQNVVEEKAKTKAEAEKDLSAAVAKLSTRKEVGDET